MRLLSANLIALLALLGTLAAPAFAAPATAGAGTDPGTLETAIGDRLARVQEFKFIQERAAQLGLRAWLFGGTAAGYAHYVAWDLQRENGDRRYLPQRFDYDYTNIYRSNQDLDIVVDGTPEQARALENELQAKFPHMQGSKAAWEIRLLRTAARGKEALLDNPDFLNQHTDSNSTGLIELTRPPASEARVRDLRSWDSSRESNLFLRDLAESRIHYYFSSKHASTARAAAGLNPPILSAIRFLTKAFQYELEISPEDLRRVRKLIHGFAPRSVPPEGYVASWIERNARKLIQNAVNVEYASKVLDETGLRKKLLALSGAATGEQNLAWWMSKTPLPSLPVGKGTGQTAAELFAAQSLEKGPGGELLISHQTGTWEAYESITRSHQGALNALMSRDGGPNEAAIHGDGFYARAGREGVGSSGLNIRMALDPQARLGTDFLYVPGEKYFVLKNRNAVRVLSESADVTVKDLFLALRDGTFLDSDRAALEKLRRRVGNRMYAISPDEEAELVQLVREQLVFLKPYQNNAMVTEWMRLPISHKHLDLITEGLQHKESRGAMLTLIAAQPSIEPWAAEIAKLIGPGEVPAQLSAILQHADAVRHPEWIRELLKYPQHHPLAAEILLYHRDAGGTPKARENPAWAAHPEFVEALFEGGHADETLMKAPLASFRPEDRMRWSKGVLARNTNRGLIDHFVQSKMALPPLDHDAPLLLDLLRRGADPLLVLQTVSESAAWADHPEVINSLLETGKVRPTDLVYKILDQPAWLKQPELIKLVIKNARDETVGQCTTCHAASAMGRLMANPAIGSHPELVGVAMDVSPRPDTVAANLAYATLLKGQPEVVETVIKHPRAAQIDPAMMKLLLEEPTWRDDPALRALSGGRAPTQSRLSWAFRKGHSVAAWRAGSLDPVKIACQQSMAQLAIGTAKTWAKTSAAASARAYRYFFPRGRFDPQAPVMLLGIVVVGPGMMFAAAPEYWVRLFKGSGSSGSASWFKEPLSRSCSPRLVMNAQDPLRNQCLSIFVTSCYDTDRDSREKACASFNSRKGISLLFGLAASGHRVTAEMLDQMSRAGDGSVSEDAIAQAVAQRDDVYYQVNRAGLRAPDSERAALEAMMRSLGMPEGRPEFQK